MNRGVLVRRLIVGALGWALAGAIGVQAQHAPVASRVVDTVNDADSLRIPGNVHPYARPAYDRGALADSQPMSRMLLLLQRGADQEQSLRQLLDQQQTKGSGSYHSWLTPEQFGKQFGPADADVQAVTDWLTSQGFQISKVSQGRTVIEFSGNVGQVRKAFHTEIHRYVVNDEEHFANVSDPQIPTALSPVVAGVVALHNFPRRAQVKKLGVFRRDLTSGQISPMVTYGTGSTPNFALGPGDFDIVYNVPPTIDGTGQTIAVVAQSNINLQDICDFRTLFNLQPQCPAYTAANTGNLQVILNGPDPGISQPDEGESDLDVEWAGAIAPQANIKFVVSQSAYTDPYVVIGGVDLSALYIVDNNIASILSESYGACEATLGTTGNAFYNALWQQAAAEGITVVVASGDSGSAGCDPTLASPNAAVDGVAVSGISSTPYNVSVGGTDFDSSTQNSVYWSTTSGTVNSALKYMPEITWNDSACAINYPTGPCSSVASDGSDVTGGSGGPSCFVTTTSGSSCPGGYAKPPYQIANSNLGIPNTTGFTTRLQPDVSFFASNGQNGVALVVCDSDSSDQKGSPCSLSSTSSVFTLAGGTSAGTPSFAGVMALVNQQTGQRQGNANYVLYGLAESDTNYTSHACTTANTSGTVQVPNAACIFNDIAKGNNSVACLANTTNCSNTSSTGYGVLIYQGNAAAFTSGPGYDLATGLGSINVGNLVTKWSKFSRTTTTTTIGMPTPTSGASGSTNFTIPVTVAPAPSTSGETVGIAAYASDQATVLGAVGPFALNGSGTVSAKSNLLPPSTAYIQAYYGGDVTLGASTSSMVALSVSGSNQASKTTVGFVEFDANGNPLTPQTGSVSVAYGSPYILQILVTPPNGTACTTSGSNTVLPPANPCPVGTIALTDNGKPLNDWPIATNIAKLNGEGIAEDQPIQLAAAGSHNIAAAFTSGDTNFQNSTSNTLAVTITQAATSTAVASSMNPIASGQIVTLTAQVSTTSNGEAPCGITNGGTVQFTLDTTAISGTVNYTAIPGSTSSNGTASCLATISTSIAGLYPPPSLDRRFRLTPWVPITLAFLSILFFALALQCKPQTRGHAYVYAALLAAALTAIMVGGCGGGGGGGGGGGTNHTIGATYSGDTNYAKSAGSKMISVQ